MLPLELWALTAEFYPPIALRLPARDQVQVVKSVVGFAVSSKRAHMILRYWECPLALIHFPEMGLSLLHRSSYSDYMQWVVSTTPTRAMLEEIIEEDDYGFIPSLFLDYALTHNEPSTITRLEEFLGRRAVTEYLYHTTTVQGLQLLAQRDPGLLTNGTDLLFATAQEDPAFGRALLTLFPVLQESYFDEDRARLLFLTSGQERL